MNKKVHHPASQGYFSQKNEHKSNQFSSNLQYWDSELQKLNESINQPEFCKKNKTVDIGNMQQIFEQLESQKGNQLRSQSQFEYLKQIYQQVLQENEYHMQQFEEINERKQQIQQDLCNYNIQVQLMKQQENILEKIKSQIPKQQKKIQKLQNDENELQQKNAMIQQKAFCVYKQNLILPKQKQKQQLELFIKEMQKIIKNQKIKIPVIIHDKKTSINEIISKYNLDKPFYESKLNKMQKENLKIEQQIKNKKMFIDYYIKNLQK